MPEDLDEDWEELDSKWYKNLREISNRLKAKYPDLKIEISTSEKYYRECLHSDLKAFVKMIGYKAENTSNLYRAVKKIKENT
jgi:hypothetical protein